MALFHRHSFTTFICHADEIDGLQILAGVDVQTKHPLYLSKHQYATCPDHGQQIVSTYDRTCRRCSYKFEFDKLPDFSDIMVTYKKCNTCSHYLVDVQCGKNKYSVNNEYVAQKIELLKKKKEDDEVDRLLNLGNPDYKAPKEGESVDGEKLIREYMNVIDKLQDDIRKITSCLNNSLTNDGIWEALPMTVKRELVARYGRKAKEHPPLDPDEIIKKSGILELKREMKS